MKTIEFTEDEIKFLLEMINVLNFKGDSIELAYEIKKKIKEAFEQTKKE